MNSVPRTWVGKSRRYMDDNWHVLLCGRHDDYYRGDFFSSWREAFDYAHHNTPIPVKVK